MSRMPMIAHEAEVPGGTQAAPETSPAVPECTPASWGAQGASVNPMRLDLIAVLARRAQALPQGAVRNLLDARIAALMEKESGRPAAQAAMEAAGMQPAKPWQEVGVAVNAMAMARGPLGQLADALAARQLRGAPADLPGPLASPVRACDNAAAATESGLTAAAPAQRDLATLHRFRDTWSRLSAEQRLRQALAQVPQQAGPLNSHHLVHRALVLMQQISPAYLERFVAHVDTLLWLERRQAPAAGPSMARADTRRKATRG